jgi:hypothetical protein
MTESRQPSVQGNDMVGSSIVIGNNAQVNVTGDGGEIQRLRELIDALARSRPETDLADQVDALLQDARAEIAAGNVTRTRNLLQRLTEGAFASAIAAEFLPQIHHLLGR